MAWQSEAVTAAQLVEQALDKPIIVGNNILELSSVPPQWRQAGSWASGSDLTVSGFETRFAYDRKAKLYTKAAGAGAADPNVLSLIFDLTESTASSGYFDMAAIIGHNYHQVSGALATIHVDVSNLNTFAIGADTALNVAQWTKPVGGWTIDRLLDLSLSSDGGSTTNRRLWNVRYVRLRHEFDDDYSAGTYPRIGELWLGKKQQFGCWPSTTYPDQQYVGESADLVTESGNRDTHTLWGGAGDRSLDFTLTGTYDSVAPLREAYEHASFGRKPFLWIEHPASADTTAHAKYGPLIMRTKPELRIELVDVLENSVNLDMIELPPFRRGER